MEDGQPDLIERLRGAKADKDAAVALYDQALLAALRGGITAREMAEATGMSYGAVHRRARKLATRE